MNFFTTPRFLLVALGLVTGGLASPLAWAQTEQPNILFIMADDLGWGDVSTPLTTMGNPSDFYETPTLEFLATHGMAFTNAYANPTCAPTRTALLSGAYAPRPTNNVYQVSSLDQGGDDTLLLPPGQGTNGSNDKLSRDTVTYAETLGTAGYTTGTVGKFHVASNINQITTAHGFDENFGGGTSGGPGAYHAENEMFGNSVDVTLDPYAANYTQAYVDANIKPYANGTSLAAIDALVGTAKHLTDASTDAALDFMSNHADSPFFLQYSAHAVHTPIDESQARADLLDKYEQAPGAEDYRPPYAALIEGLDQGVARLVDYLQTTPDPSNPGQTLDQNTLVIFYSDNGGTAATVSPDNTLSGSKGTLNEGGIRVPLIAWSGNADLVESGTINDSVVMPMDFYATFASLAEADLPTTQIIDGQDLSGLFADNSAELDRENVYWHLPGYAQGRAGQSPQSVTRSDDWKLFYSYEDQSYELYDLLTDPGETDNLADEYASVTHDLAMDMLLWLDEVDAPLATLRNGSIDLLINGLAYADGEITEHNNETVTILAGEEVPFVVDFLAGLTGDYNADGFVSQADLDLVLLNWGNTTVPPAWVDTDQFDGLQVSQNELDGVLLNWGNGTPPSVAVPEPATATAFATLVICLGTRSRWRAGSV